MCRYVPGPPHRSARAERRLRHRARRSVPVAIEQALDVRSWAGRTTELWDGRRISVGGQSAGGALATAVARRARDEGGPHLLAQVLHHPPLDLTRPARDKPSPRGSRAVVKPWMSIVFDTAYVPDRARRSNPFVSPAHRPDPSDLVGVAPALVVTAAEDRLRQEAVDYAQALDAAGALIAWHDVPGVDHGCSIADATAGAATRASCELIAQTLRTRHETL